MKRILLVLLLVSVLVISGCTDKQELPKPQPDLQPTTRMQLPFCDTVEQCETEFRNHGVTDEEIASVNIQCINSVCWGNADATEPTEEEDMLLDICPKAQLFISKAEYSDGVVDVTVYNSGDVTLEDFRFIITYSDSTTSEEETSFELASGASHTFSIEVGNNLESVLAQSKLCRGTQDMISGYDIRGLG